MGMYKDSNSVNSWDLGIVDLKKWEIIREACVRQYNAREEHIFDNILNFDVANSKYDQDYKDYLYSFIGDLKRNLTDLEKYALTTSYYFYDLHWNRAKDDPGTETAILKKIFRLCNDMVLQRSDKILYTELPPGIDRLKVIKKTREEKYGLFGSKKRIVEYDEENPKFQKITNIVENEPFICIWRTCFLQEKPYGAAGDVYADILTQSGRLYHFEYDVYGDVKDEPWVGTGHLGNERIILNLSYLIGELFNCKPLQELLPDDFHCFADEETIYKDKTILDLMDDEKYLDIMTRGIIPHHNKTFKKDIKEFPDTPGWNKAATLALMDHTKSAFDEISNIYNDSPKARETLDGMRRYMEPFPQSVKEFEDLVSVANASFEECPILEKDGRYLIMVDALLHLLRFYHIMEHDKNLDTFLEQSNENIAQILVDLLNIEHVESDFEKCPHVQIITAAVLMLMGEFQPFLQEKCEKRYRELDESMMWI